MADFQRLALQVTENQQVNFLSETGPVLAIENNATLF